MNFTSRRSAVLCLNGCVSSSQNLASTIGLQILQNKNGNAIDASIAIAAALAVLEPCSTGLGGDMFALIYLEKDKKVYAINGSGRSPSGLTLDIVKEKCDGGGGDSIENEFMLSPLSVTVPGAAKGWEDLYLKYGSGNISFQDLLEPAAKLAEDGFPVGPITAHSWQNEMYKIHKWLPKDTAEEDIPLSINGRAPKVGQIMHNPELANVLRSLGKYGASDGFYNAFPGKNIIQTLKKLDCDIMTQDDLMNHTSTFPEPIGVEYRNIKLWQVPPNGQGIASLIALKGLQALEDSGRCEKITKEFIGEVEYLHPLIEMMHLGFEDAISHVTDLDHMLSSSSSSSNENNKSVSWLLDDDRIARRALSTYNDTKAVASGKPESSSCTVSFQVVDKEGNAVSFVNSNYMGFGTGIIPSNCGFTLHNRGYGFSLLPDHPNVVEGNKRPYHTIIPGMITYKDTNELYASISNMGAFMQPQGHLQLTVAMVAGGLDPQSAIDLPRFRITGGGCGMSMNGEINLEEGFDQKVINKLKEMGHVLSSCEEGNNTNGDDDVVKGYKRSIFGRAQIIKRDRETGVLWAGSDGRADGCAMGY